jgi:hypothetical protein
MIDQSHQRSTALGGSDTPFGVFDSVLPEALARGASPNDSPSCMSGVENEAIET